MSSADPQQFFLYLSFYLSAILTFAYILLFGDHDCHRGTPIAALHAFFLNKLPTFCHERVLSRILGSSDRANKLTYSVGRAFEKWIMPTSYVLLLIGGLYTAQVTIVPRLPQLEAMAPDSPCPRSRLLCTANGWAFPPRTSPSAIPIYAVIALASWLRVMLADPGVVTSETHSRLVRLYRYDEVMFVSDAPECRTCHLRKLARSKHCATCDRCVARFDHHCGWVGTCVGLYNTRHFITFLGVHCIMVAHGVALCAEIVRARIQELVEGRFVYTPTNTPIKGFSLRVALAAEMSICVLFLVFVITLSMIGGFLVYHLSLVVRNVTTNESAKWQAFREAARSFEQKHGKPIAQAMREEAEEEAANGDRELLEKLPEFGRDGVPVHIYASGVVANCFEVFFPRAFVRRRVACGDTQTELSAAASVTGKTD